MDDSLRTRRARTFGGVADVYERTRPGYPDEAVLWMAGPDRRTVLELGAGTGKLTAGLLGHGHRVVATDHSAAMLRGIRRRLEGARVVQASAERLPFAAASVDTVVAGQAFHWFDTDRALPEIARVLRPGGTLALAWNIHDETVPWVRRLRRVIGAQPPPDPTGLLEDSSLFGGVEQHTFRHWHQVYRDSLIGLVESHSSVAELSDGERADVLTRVGELYDEYGRGHDGMVLPYDCEAYRCRVSGAAAPRRAEDPPLDDGLLIDFS
jgi:SAM-dependent methyltransferase